MCKTFNLLLIDYNFKEMVCITQQKSHKTRILYDVFKKTIQEPFVPLFAFARREDYLLRNVQARYTVSYLRKLL